jgi:selenocysteine lyase/cysteine desulfurase
VVTIREDADGRLDSEHLDYELRRYVDRPLKIGSFSAASNVTGIITDVDRASQVLARHGALSCWDYATAGPYLPISMAGKDAVFLSPHKFVGGPGTPGVLGVKQDILRNRVPSVPGGGTILFVSPRGHTYDPDPVTREEGGTPEIVGSIRAGLVFALKEQVGAEEIRRVERDFARRALASWEPNPHIQILGNTSVDRLPIVSFGLRHPPRLLHSNFVVALLSDLFGIQARSGCFCAGPYIHRTYPIDDNWSARMDAECSLGHLGARLAFVRVGFNYFISEAVFAYILEAIHLLAEHAWKLLPLYHFDPASGLWRHRDACPPPTLANAPVARVTRESEHALTKRLEDARAIIRAVESSPPRVTDSDRLLSPQFERIRWFPLAREARARLARADARSTMSA